MDLSNILVIAGKPDLSELVSQTKGGAVVKNLVTGQKYPVFRTTESARWARYVSSRRPTSARWRR